MPSVRSPEVIVRELGTEADAVRVELLGPAGREPGRAADLGAELAELTERRARERERASAHRFQTLERIHAALGRLRDLPDLPSLVSAAGEELAHCCEFDRSAVSSIRGSHWRAETIWTQPGHDPALTRRIVEGLGDWMPLKVGVLEGELVRRRAPALVRAEGDRREDEVMAISHSRARVAAPVFAAGRVVGILQADCFGSGRELTAVDCDNIASFADGFGLVFERTALLQRLDRQRSCVRQAFEATERQLGRLEEEGTTLVRHDRESVAAVRRAAARNAPPPSPVDTLLTARERQVVELMVKGARNRQIADELVISEETVKSHVRSISRKLRASSRAEAVSRYLRLRRREYP